jgi:SAM-dependent methyltransferase
VNSCRSCGSPTEHVLSLGEMPLANHLLAYPSESYKKYPLDLMFCPSCKLGQLRDQVDPGLMFEEYVYYSSVNGPTVESAKALVTNPSITQVFLNKIPDTADGNILVAEIGSNDGYLLQHYAKYSIPVLGVDPAKGPANAAALKGIPTVQDYFTLKLARTLPKADVIYAHNVLAHVQDLNDFVAGIAEMLKPDGVVVIEVPYLGDMLDKGTWDLCYHEHNYYFSVHAAFILFARHNLFLNKVERIPSHGGSLRMFLGNSEFRGFTCVEEQFDFDRLRDEIVQQTNALFDFIRDTRVQVWGFGAAAKATAMLYYCGICDDLIPKIADSTPAKIGKFIPGTGVRIVHTDEWLQEQPKYTCIFAWNYEEEIRKKYQGGYKGTFFTPYKLPQ